MGFRSGRRVIYVEARQRLVDWLRRQLIGPAGHGNLRLSPLDRFPTGVLFPIQPGVSGIDPAAATPDDAGPEATGDEDEDPLAGVDGAEIRRPARPVGRRRYVPPSAVGFSGFVRGAARLSITVGAATYTRVGDRDDEGRFQSLEYERNALPEQVVAWSGPESSDASVWEGRAGVDVRARPWLDGRILTVTLFNRQRLDRDEPTRARAQDLAERSLFEARLECVVDAGELVEYPRVDPSLLTDEERELELQYADRRIHAVGHGAAVDWRVEPGRPARIRTAWMPAADTPLVTVDTGGDAVLGIERLAEASRADDLARFVARYGAWIGAQREAAARLEAGREAASRLCGRLGGGLGRVQRGGGAAGRGRRRPAWRPDARRPPASAAGWRWRSGGCSGRSSCCAPTA